MIEEVLRQGSDNGIKMSELAAMFRCSERVIRQRVHAERLRGALILAGGDGFYLPSEDPETALCELLAFERQMTPKAEGILATLQSTRDEIEKLRN